MALNVSGGLCSVKTEPDGGCLLSNDDTLTGKSDISIGINGADLKRTLGEILACCQVTYAAILKLEEKFDMLKAKVVNIQTHHENPSALPSQKMRVSSGNPDSFQSRSKSLPTSMLSVSHLPHISSSLSVENRKLPTLSPGPVVKKPLRLNIQNQSHNSVQKPSLKMSRTEHHLFAQGCVGKSERKGFLPNSVLHKAGKMARPSAAVRYLSQNMFTTEELSESSTTGNPNRRLKRLDPSKINDIREWAVKRYPKFDLREKGKEWKICLSVINATARYFRFMGKTRKQKMNATKTVTPRVEVSPACTAEIDVELSGSDTEQKPQIMQRSKINSTLQCVKPADMNYYSTQGVLVYIGSPHREVKVPKSALSAAHMRKRPELIARYLIKFIFSEDVLVRSNVYGARTGIDPLDHNRISALREHLAEHFPWMKLEEDGCDWKVCVGAINSTIRKCRYERKMGIKKGKC